MEKTMEKPTNNSIVVSGCIASEAEFSHESFGENFYVFMLNSERSSGVLDCVPICVSERLYDIGKLKIGGLIEVTGEIRTYNKIEKDHKRLIISVFAKDITDHQDVIDDTNSAELTGFICKEPTYRTTPNGREICDVLLAVNRAYGKSDYIPCISWGRNARFVEKLPVGTQITLYGRLQSREYHKRIGENPDGTCVAEVRTAYELSVSRLVS